MDHLSSGCHDIYLLLKKYVHTKQIEKISAWNN